MAQSRFVEDTNKDLYTKVNKIQRVPFTEQEIFMFKSVSCRDIVISVATDTSNSKSCLWVEFVVLTHFTNLYLYNWKREVHADTPLAIEQRSILCDILLKITLVYNLAVRHNCFISNWVDLRKLLRVAMATKMENKYLATYSHNEFDILEIEKCGLEQSTLELQYDKRDTAIIQELIAFSKLMAFDLHGLYIF
jgi:hypothetical protein